MAEVKDPAIKLFGKTIQLPLNGDVLAEFACSEQNFSCSNEKNEIASDSKLEDGSSSTVFTEPTNKEPAKSSTGDNNQAMPNSEDNNHSSCPKPSQKEDQSETGSSSQDNNNNNKPPLKKPDKILPCPRCNSMDTKFCYFNNYNVNQPRHFCKNCQRYWTAGGTMRNVPVGAGRRKSKNSSHHHRHVIVPQTANGMVYPSLAPNGSVLAFGSDAPLCDSMASALNIAENSNSKSSNTNSKSSEVNASHEKQGGFTAQVPCFPAPPWATPWNPTQWSPTVHAPPFLPSGFPLSIYPTTPPPYWGSWPMPWIQRPSGSTDPSLASSSPNSPLGKHSRDGNVLTPKTLRIDDPNEAAKSSIWATLGIKNEKAAADSINAGGLFRGFKSKGENAVSSAAETSLVLQANPAALSRSLTFHESAR